jgi:hypothetical protein
VVGSAAGVGLRSVVINVTGVVVVVVGWVVGVGVVVGGCGAVVVTATGFNSTHHRNAEGKCAAFPLARRFDFK